MKMESKKLGKLKMPEKRKALDTSGLDEGSPEEEAAESPDEEANEGDTMEGDVDLDKMNEDSPMAGLSDEDLMAEVKKRGLEKKLAEGGESHDDLDLGM